MVNKKIKKKKQQTKKKSQRKKLSIEFIALLIILFCLVGIFNLGIIGQWINLLFASIVGTLHWIALFLIASYALFRMIKGKSYSETNKRIIGITLLAIGIIIIIHSQSLNIDGNQSSIWTSTIQALQSMFRTKTITNDIGSGLIGGILYQMMSILLGKWGSLSFAVIIILFGGLITVGATWADVVAQGRLLYGKISDTFKNMSGLNHSPSSIKEGKPKESIAARLKNQANQLIVSDVLDDDNQPAPKEGKVPADEKLQEIEKISSIPSQLKSETQSDEATAVLEKIKKEREAYEAKLKTKKNERTLLDVNEDEQASLDEEVEKNYSDEHLISNKTFVSMQEANQLKNKNYQLPPLNLLNKIETIDQSSEYDVIEKNIIKLESTFKSFGVDATVVNAHLGPAVTKFEVKPALGVKVNKIVQLTDDLALALAAKDIRIEAPIPGKPFVGIEVPNQTVNMVSFREVVEPAIQSENILDVALGRGMSGATILGNLAKMPHLLVAGATGSGKSVAINGMITSLLLKAKPNEVKMLMIDPKKVELSVYNDIPHLLTPVVTNPKKAAQALQKVVEEMERRYELFAASGTRNMASYNEEAKKYADETGNVPEVLPYIVVVVDELADLMMVASNEVESAIIRLAQMARAAGIHMVLATQRPSVDVITGIIKANVPSRIAFSVSSGTDSRTIIDSNGAEKLLGRGDMLFLPMGASKPDRVQGAFISDEEVERIVNFVKEQENVDYVAEMSPTLQSESSTDEPEDELFYEVVELIKSQETISISMLQRKFRIGYNRAARLIDDLEARQMVSPPEGSKPRQVLIESNSQSDIQTIN
ncbi:FtsK/SpoIIIE family DNA translocase [Atopobacter phocae]|uniref:FtsK/SpoIIIE family DNA translocase n=1 Tax=Atopobacter phocae TaxID=136492 RepID=UPI00146FA606|nr:DNA translocase FtsK [Atopobacter phocae]